MWLSFFFYRLRNIKFCLSMFALLAFLQFKSMYLLDVMRDLRNDRMELQLFTWVSS